MGFYARHVLPRVVDRVCGSEATLEQRARVVPAARGRVVEIGIGSGLNLPFYDATRVERVWGVDPSPEMWRLGSARRSAVAFDVEFVHASAEEIPLATDSADSAVVTFSLCTIPDPVRALREVRRLLRPGGELLWCEHGKAPDASVQRWQRRLNPLWRRLSGGCHLDRPVPELLEAGGFRLREAASGYLPGWKPASYHFWGRAILDDEGGNSPAASCV